MSTIQPPPSPSFSYHVFCYWFKLNGPCPLTMHLYLLHIQTLTLLIGNNFKSFIQNIHLKLNLGWLEKCWKRTKKWFICFQLSTNFDFSSHFECFNWKIQSHWDYFTTFLFFSPTSSPTPSPSPFPSTTTTKAPPPLFPLFFSPFQQHFCPVYIVDPLSMKKDQEGKWN